MKIHSSRSRLAYISAVLLTMAGCGGGGGGGNDTPVLALPTTTDVKTTVIDGAIEKAVVCLDKNSNGKCDPDEVQAKTDRFGNVTLAVPNADVGKHAIIALVGTDAIDADHGPVTVAYTMSAPADQVGVVSPLTTLVQQTVASTGASTLDAAKAVQEATGITVSLFQDFTKTAAPVDGSISAATVARMLVVTTQQQQTTVASAVGMKAIDGSSITQVDLDKAIQKKLLELLPALVTALSDPAVLAAATPKAKETALLAAATTLVIGGGLNPSVATTVVAINNQATVVPPTAPPAAFIQLVSLTFTDATNYVVRLFTGSVAQATPDASNNTHYVERRQRSSGGTLAKWGAGNDPSRNADLNWNGSAWVSCPINFENTSSVRDAQGNNSYSYCDKRETGNASRATFDIAGKTMTEVYAQIRAASYTNLTVTDATLLGRATFPAGSALVYQTSMPLTQAFAYYPAGANSPAGLSNITGQYSAAVAVGGDASAQAAGTGCNAYTVNANGSVAKIRERDTNGSNSTTLEGLIAAKAGTPCVFSPTASFTYGGTSYTTPDANAGWSIATVNLGKVGTAPVGTGPAPGFYSGNVLLRAAFTGGSAVTYYSCKERFDSGAIRACVPVGTGTYSIATLGDARVMTLTNPPVQAAALTYNRVFIERGGFVYIGYQNKPLVTNAARLNTTAATALLSQLGVTAENPSVPLALTAGSYTGTWDVRGAAESVTSSSGITISLNANGSRSCFDKGTASAFACSVTIGNAATGAFTFLGEGYGAASGNFNFLSGTASGMSTSTPTDIYVGGRR